MALEEGFNLRGKILIIENLDGNLVAILSNEGKNAPKKILKKPAFLHHPMCLHCCVRMCM